MSDLGRAYQIAREYTRSEQYLLESITIWEKLRVGLENKESYRISLFETQTETYQALQQVRIAMQKYPEALEAAEQGRARAFVALLSAKLRSDRTQQYTEPKVTVQNLQQIARDKELTIVSYSLISQKAIGSDLPSRGNSQLYVWVISPNGEINFRDLDLQRWERTNEKSLVEIISNLQKRLKNASGTRGANQRKPLPKIDNSTEELHLLYQLLIQPIEKFLPKDPEAKVVFVPHNALFLVPFAALRNSSQKYLIEKHTISYAPSIQLLESTQKLRDRPKGTEFLIVGNPTVNKFRNLINAEVEAQVIAKLLNTTPIIGNDATKVKVLEKITNSKIIHFAAHGEFDDQNGLNGGIIFANDNPLTAENILQLKLTANLVVLSACDTAKGKITGDGVIGLSRAFILAGTPSIVVSLWSVPDAPTGQLMVEFYRNIQFNSDYAKALRQAMLTIMKEKDYQNPRNWAAFNLIGSFN